MSEALAEIREGFSKKEIKMAIGVASDPRYKQGNYTGAVNAIEKIKKGLSKHPQVAAVLKRQNEKLDKEDEPFVKDLVKNLRKGSATHSKQADDLEKAVKEETELDEQFDFVLLDKDNKIVGRYSGKNAKKEAESSKKSAHLPPMRIPKNEVGKMKIVPISPKDKKGIGDMVLAIGEEVELDEDKSSTVYDFDRLIKDGGLDKRDFRKAKNLYVSGKLMDLRKFIYNLDTSPLEAIMDVIAKNDPKAFMKMYPKSKKGEYMSSIAYAHKEEVELDERDKKNRYVRPMDRKFSDTQKSNIQINQEVQGLYDRIMGKTGIKYKREYMRGVPGRKNKQTHAIVVNKKDKNAANKAVKNYNFSPIEKEVFVRKGHFVVVAVDNLDDRDSWYDKGMQSLKQEYIPEGLELDEAKEVLSRFKDDKLKKSIMNLATQKGLKVKEMGDKLEVSGNARKVMDLTLAVQKHDVKVEHNMMSAYTAAITKGVK